MIITNPIPSLASYEDQSINGHGVTFTNGVYTLASNDTSPPVGLTGFNQPVMNAESEYSYMLDLVFSANPASWQLIMQTAGLVGKVITWNGQEVGTLNGNELVVQHSNAANAVNDHVIRLLIPRLAAPTSIRMTLGNAEQGQLVAATWAKCLAVMHPCPKVDGTLKHAKRSRKAFGGRKVVTFQSANKVFSCRVAANSWGSSAQLADIDALDDLQQFAVYPSGLSTEFTRTSDVKWRRTTFARNCSLADYSGLSGYDGLDAGPIAIKLGIEEQR